MALRTSFIATLAIAFCFTVGCEPSNETNTKDERSVRQATPTDLDESAIRRIIELEGAEPPKDSGHEGAILRINGVVSGIETKTTEGAAKTLVKVTLLDEPKYSANCYFTDENRTTIQQLQLGETLRVSGKCRYVFDSWMELSGCVID